MGFAQAPCPALLQSEPRAKLPLTVTGAIWLVLEKKNQQNLRGSPKNSSGLSGGRLLAHVVDF